MPISRKLDEPALDDFERLIEVPNGELYAWVAGDTAVPADHDTAVLRDLIAFNARRQGRALTRIPAGASQAPPGACRPLDARAGIRRRRRGLVIADLARAIGRRRAAGPAISTAGSVATGRAWPRWIARRSGLFAPGHRGAAVPAWDCLAVRPGRGSLVATT